MAPVPPSRVIVSSAGQKLLEQLLSHLWPAPTLLEVSTALPLPPGSPPCPPCLHCTADSENPSLPCLNCDHLLAPQGVTCFSWLGLSLTLPTPDSTPGCEAKDGPPPKSCLSFPSCVAEDKSSCQVLGHTETLKWAEATFPGYSWDSSSCLPMQSGHCELFSGPPTLQFCPGSCHPLSQTTDYPQACLPHTAPERLYQTR